MLDLGHDPYAAGDLGGLDLVSVDERSAARTVALHVPLTEETTGMIGAAQLEAMKPGSLIVNTSRGGLVVQEDLFDALRRGTTAAPRWTSSSQSRWTRVRSRMSQPDRHPAHRVPVGAIEESQRKATTQVMAVLTGRRPDFVVAGQ